MNRLKNLYWLLPSEPPRLPVDSYIDKTDLEIMAIEHLQLGIKNRNEIENSRKRLERTFNGKEI